MERTGSRPWSDTWFEERRRERAKDFYFLASDLSFLFVSVFQREQVTTPQWQSCFRGGDYGRFSSV
mgnify:FL=1